MKKQLDDPPSSPQKIFIRNISSPKEVVGDKEKHCRASPKEPNGWASEEVKKKNKKREKT